VPAVAADPLPLRQAVEDLTPHPPQHRRPSQAGRRRDLLDQLGVVTAVRDQPEVLLVQSQAGFEPGMKFAGGSGVMGPTQAS